MGLIVQKFGGSSVKDVERIRKVAEQIIRECDNGNQVIVAVSAMGKTTDRLVEMAFELCDEPPAREMDMLLATGEQVSIAMLAIALEARGKQAVSFTGPQVGIQTDGVHGSARIVHINDAKIREALAADKIVVVAGFQGASGVNEITTLGRGGSDTTAVALAAALEADRCDIYTDVKGVYTADPRVVPKARLLKNITYDEMLELASVGAKVLHGRSVEIAKKYRVPLRVLSSYESHPGTMVVEAYDHMEDFIVSGVSCDRNSAKISILGVPDKPGIAAQLFSRIAQEHINVDMIVQNVGANDRNDISFTVTKEMTKKAVRLAEALCKEIDGRKVEIEDDIAKISVVGVGMKSHSGVASRMFKALASIDVSIKMISTSEIYISCVIDTAQADEATRAVHAEFGLDATDEA